MTAKTPTADSIFSVAVDIESEAKREQYLENACGEDVELKNVVIRLVEAHFRSGSFMDWANQNAQPTSAHTMGDGFTSQQVGCYKLREKLGEGGMGVVYAAEQERPIRRKVALKIIKPGMDSREVISRFEAERQALAMMDHQNIARVLDAGTTEAGLPYFVMELVRGVTVTEYCDNNRLSVRERLELFTQICKAVQHAHQKGIIHRDIKPSNVMITLHDGVPVPKVIDFGVAKAINQRLTEGTAYTKVAQMLGTPAYMSPEQAELSGLDIDTRSDIYSLGVMLYELLTGSTPFTKEQLSNASFDEMRRVIRETDPQRPSDRVSTMQAEAMSTVADRRSRDPRTLSNSLRGELDWIVMKSLEKDRNRRYETANGFAMDVQRYLTNDPVSAGAPSKLYRLRKFGLRNRGALIATTAISIVLVLGIITTTWQAMRASTALKEKTIALNERTVALEDSQAAWERESVMTNLVLGQIVSSAEPGTGNPDATVRGALLDVEKKMDAEGISDPSLEAWLRHNVAGYFLRVGEYMAAKRNSTRAYDLRLESFGSEDEQTRSTANQLSEIYSRLGEHDQALALARRLVEIRSRMAGDESKQTLEIRNSLCVRLLRAEQFKEAEPMLTQTIEQAKRLGFEKIELGAVNNLGNLYYATEKHDKARQSWTTALEISRRIYGDDDPATIAPASNLANLLKKSGRLDEAEESLAKLVSKAEAIYGPDSPYAIRLVKNLAGINYQLRNFENSAKLARQVLEAKRSRFGQDSVQTLDSLQLLAASLKHIDSEECRTLHEKAVEIAKREWGIRNKTTLFYLNGLGTAAQDFQDYKTSSDCFQSIIEARRALQMENPNDHENTFMLGCAHCNLGFVWKARNDLDAIEHFTNAIGVFEELLKVDSRPVTRQFLSYSYGGRASARRYVGQHEQSLEDIQNALAVSDTDRQRAILELTRAQTVAAQGDCVEAVKIAKAAVQGFAEDSEVAYELAAVYAISANVVATDRSTARESSQEVQAAEFVNKSFVALELAKSLGHFEATSSQLHFQSAPNYAAVRGDPRYSQFVGSFSSTDKKKPDSGSPPTTGKNLN